MGNNKFFLFDDWVTGVVGIIIAKDEDEAKKEAIKLIIPHQYEEVGTDSIDPEITLIKESFIIDYGLLQAPKYKDE